MSNPFETLAETLARIEEAILQKSKDAPIPETLLSKKETAELLGISLNSLDKYTRNGTIPAFGIGSRILYKRSQVLESLICINK